jgi:tryptophan halogenase
LDINKIAIVGGGTAGLVTALIIKKSLPKINVEIVESSKIGIIGVGEGSTEHWRQFMEICEIPLAELIVKTRATHKNGIRFINWTEHTPDYFHSVGGVVKNTKFGIFGLYNKLIFNGKTLTESLSPPYLVEDCVPMINPHTSVNQYHFDTFALNEYLHTLCMNANIVITDGEVSNVVVSDAGDIDSLKLEDGRIVESQLWIDASGMSRLLMKKVSKAEWTSVSNYLQMNSAIAFPTKSDESGKIHPYTIAKATKYGWMWEIPTQDRRGNGYVYCSDHITEEDAVKEAQIEKGVTIENYRSISFDPGYLKKMWVKNCIAVGLASSFFEPIEATSIGSTIQQAKAIVENLSGYVPGSEKIQNYYNSKMQIMIDNIVSMIALHYISDRRDSPMWEKQSTMEIPDYLSNLLDLWKTRAPLNSDIPTTNYEMFMVPHFYHVVQGQKLFNKDAAARTLSIFGIEQEVHNEYMNVMMTKVSHGKLDHAEALKQIQI